MYDDAGSGGALSLSLSVVFIGLLSPIGEESLPRDVVANALLRYGPFIGAVGSALILALSHGINVVLPAAFVMGLITAELLRRSGSVWPAVVVHVIYNAVGQVMNVLFAGAG